MDGPAIGLIYKLTKSASIQCQKLLFVVKNFGPPANGP
jgi:hypothetical protein